jgi:hypothetical protein
LGVRQISSEEDSKYACAMCGKNAYNYEFESENLCFSCFEQKYGKVLLFTDRAEYYGGHKNNEERKQGIQQVVKEI